MTRPSAHTIAAAQLHDDLQVWLTHTHSLEPVAVVVAALTFEIGRLVGIARPSDAEIDIAVNSVRETLRDQIRAHREGRLAP